jgi:hypothetical protein
MEKETACQIIGNPDFSLSQCQLCRDSADPLYKDCLTARLTYIFLNADQTRFSPETLQPAKRLPPSSFP